MTELSHFPWKTTAQTLRERFREDHLGLTASSLTFTTILALVPFFTVALAVFTAFPIFGKLQDALQGWLVSSLVPDSISRQVLGYLTQFASKASSLGAAGFSILLATALALILTIDRTLNDIWRVQRLRPLGQRVLIYWAAITLGPLLMGASLALTSYVMSASGGLVKRLPMLQPYRIDLAFDLSCELTTGPQHAAQVGSCALQPPQVAPRAQLADADWPLAALAEAGLPLVAQPYAQWAQALGTTAAQVQATLQQWLHTGVLSRFGVVVRHHELGFAANAMTVLDVPDDEVDAAGRALAAQPGVTLAYRRARAPGWRYNLYCMVHGAHRQAVEQVVASALERSGLAHQPHAVLFSRRRFKQTGGRRFAAAAPIAQGVAHALP